MGGGGYHGDRSSEQGSGRGGAGRSFRLAQRARSVHLMHMRSDAQARSRRSQGAVGSRPGFSGPVWNAQLLVETRWAFRGREVAEPEAPLQPRTEPATQASELPPPLLYGASRPVWLLHVHRIPATGNDVAGAESKCPRGQGRAPRGSVQGCLTRGLRETQDECYCGGPNPSRARRRVPTAALPATFQLKRS